MNLLGIRFTEGIYFNFPESADPSADLAPGAAIVVVKNREAFASRYGTEGILIAGEYSGNLDNGGERIRLGDVLGNTLLDFTYSDAWYPETDGEGSSLEIINSRLEPAAWNLLESWRAGADRGTPGFHAFVVPPEGGLQRPGDMTQDTFVDISDAIALLFHLFLGSRPLPCGNTPGEAGNRALLDVDANGDVSIVDAIFLLNYLFRAGQAPALGTECTRIPGCPELCSGGAAGQ